MNKNGKNISDNSIINQGRRLGELMEELVKCCQDKTVIQSERFGLNVSELKTIMLFKDEKYLTVKGISRRLSVAKSRVTKILNGMIKKGLLQRRFDPVDKRVKLFSLTPKGRKILRDIDGFTSNINTRILLRMDPVQRKALIGGLTILSSCIEEVKNEILKSKQC